ncbi:unknown [Clostridium sp. CAG:510]|nr:unknown [Clostridium sp. CAG:510]
MFPKEMKLCCRVLGTAITTISFKSAQLKRGAFSLPSTLRSLLNTTTMASTQLTPWQRKVAQATPATPMLKAFTNQISTAILDKEDTARK